MLSTVHSAHVPVFVVGIVCIIFIGVFNSIVPFINWELAIVLLCIIHLYPMWITHANDVSPPLPIFLLDSHIGVLFVVFISPRQEVIWG
jgi:hypothetical protein